MKCFYNHAPIAQSDRAVVSGTTSAGGSNPSGRVKRSELTNVSSDLFLLCLVISSNKIYY